VQPAGHRQDLGLAHGGEVELALRPRQLGGSRRGTLRDGGVEAIARDVGAETNPLSDRATRGGQQGLQRNPPGAGPMQETPDRHCVLGRRPVLPGTQSDRRAKGTAAHGQADEEDDHGQEEGEAQFDPGEAGQVDGGEARAHDAPGGGDVADLGLIADEGAVSDPRDPNDRLLLGVKGTLSEAELFTLRLRLHEGRWNKARKGLLVFPLPVGYVRGPDGTWELDPDAQVRERLGYLFATFQRLAQHLEHVTAELRQLVEEENAVVRQRDFTRPRHRPAADQRLRRRRMMRRAHRTLIHQRDAFR